MSLIVYPRGYGTKPLDQLDWLPNRIRVAIVGGGPLAFIGPHHLAALRRNAQFWHVVGVAPSRSPEKCADFRRVIPDLVAQGCEVYSDWRSMLKVTSATVVIIVTETPNHKDIALAALEAGIDVITDKPPTVTLPEMLEIQQVVVRTGRQFIATYNHNGYGAVIHAARMIQTGVIGDIHHMGVWFKQSWGLGDTTGKQGKWRFGAERCCGADIGSHAKELASALMPVGFALESVSGTCRQASPLNTPGRKGDDHVKATLQFVTRPKGGKVLEVDLLASQMFAGDDDNIGFESSGNAGSLRWSHLEPGTLHLTRGNTRETMVEGNHFTTQATFNPAGHPTGFADSWAATYNFIAGRLMVSRGWVSEDELPPELLGPVCTLPQAVDSMVFLEALYRSSDTGRPVNCVELVREYLK